MRHHQRGSRAQQSRHRGAEAAQFGIVARTANDEGVGLGDRVFEFVERLVRAKRLAVEGRKAGYGDRRSDVPAGRAAHAVGDEQQVRPRVAGVLVIGASEANVGASGVMPCEERHWVSSNVVAPIRTWSPRRSGTGSVTF